MLLHETNIYFLTWNFIEVCPLGLINNMATMGGTGCHKDTFSLVATPPWPDRRYICASLINWNLVLNSNLPSMKLHPRPPIASAAIFRGIGHSNNHSEYIVDIMTILVHQISSNWRGLTFSLLILPKYQIVTATYTYSGFQPIAALGLSFWN